VTANEADVPTALHGADYQDLWDVQKRTDDRLLEAVFLDHEFSHIQRGDLEKGYVLLGGRLKDTKFRARSTTWLKKRAPHITQQTVYYRIGLAADERRRVKREVFVNTLHPDPKAYQRPNTDQYIGKDGYKDVWNGPEI
jgi:hypothetical protein